MRNIYCDKYLAVQAQHFARDALTFAQIARRNEIGLPLFDGDEAIFLGGIAVHSGMPFELITLIWRNIEREYAYRMGLLTPRARRR